MGMISAYALGVMHAALEQQTQQLFHRVFTTESAAFYFYHNESSTPDLHIRVKMIQLLLESARTQDEELASRAQDEADGEGSFLDEDTP